MAVFSRALEFGDENSIRRESSNADNARLPGRLEGA